MTTCNAPRTNFDIQQDVVRELKWDAPIEANAVRVEVSDGLVTLRGTVACWAQRVAAREAAHRVRGVREVANDIDVRPSSGSGRTDVEAGGMRRARVGPLAHA